MPTPCTVVLLHRAELPADEDLTALNPEALLARKPFLSLVAMVAILDPPRSECIEAIKVAHTAGIEVKMITGELQMGFDELADAHMLTWQDHVLSWQESRVF